MMKSSPLKKAIACLLLIQFIQFNLLAQTNQPRAVIREAPFLRLPGGRYPAAGIEDAIDCNSPLHWDDAGRLHIFTSVHRPFRSSGADLFNLSYPSDPAILLDEFDPVEGVWLEATYRDSDGVLYGWYHNEPAETCENDPHLSAPRIGALISHDEGATWEDMGFVLTAPADSVACDTQNYYFAGGNGDFTVLLDRNKEFFYFLFGAYHRQPEEQGVAIARLRYADGQQQAGKVQKWYNGAWTEPGLGGRVTPVLPVQNDWHSSNPDAYWGPSVHYNSYLEQYVMVLNRAVDTVWGQEGVYISYNLDLADPLGWSEPERLPFEPEGRAYPEIIGTAFGETDKLAGRVARLFVLGQSAWTIEFRQPGEPELGVAPSRNPAAGPRELPTRGGTVTPPVAGRVVRPRQ